MIHGKGHSNKAVEDRLDAYWKRAQIEVYKSPNELIAQKKRMSVRGQFVATMIRGDRKRKWLALTFDDGPHPLYTRALLDILRRQKVTATFFVIGFMAEQYPYLVQAEAREGHLIGNHTFSHVTLTHLPENEVRTEYRACSDLLAKLSGKRPAYCRPPGGDYDQLVAKASADEGLTTVLWTDDPGDYASPGSSVIAERTLRRLSSGGVVLLHDGVSQTLQVLPNIIQYAKRKGYAFVTVDRFAKSAK